jgi:hypothetical protein
MPCGPSTDQDHSTTCLQSQIGQDCHLRRSRMAQVEAAVALSVAVRWGPAGTAVNGTVVARPGEDDVRRARKSRHQLDRRVRPDPGDTRLVGKGRAAGASRKTSVRPPCPCSRSQRRRCRATASDFLAAGFDRYLSKPVNVVRLVHTVRQQCPEVGREGPLAARPALALAHLGALAGLPSCGDGRP